MENQRPAKRRNEEAAGSIMKEDRVSQLPEPILDHVISLLSQKDAVRTCLLSKSWRFLGPTRPKIEFCESDFRGSEEKFLSVLDNTLQRYDDQKLQIQEFVLSMSWPDSSNKSYSRLNKWIVKLHMLKRLSLMNVWIEEETSEKIMSCCPLIELILKRCKGILTTAKLNKSRNLKHFDCYEDGVYNRIISSIEMNEAPHLEIIRIQNCQNWYHLHNNFFFPRLKSLYLFSVHFSTELLNNLSSNNFPSLENLELRCCSGFTEFNLSNCSIKRLIIIFPSCPIEAAIDAANMIYFEYTSSYLPSMISFATTSRKCKSRIEVCRSSDSGAGALSTRSFKLHEFLKALSQSQISLDTFPLTNQDTCDGNSCDPVVVEHLYLREYYLSFEVFEVPAVLNCLFRICRPRYIGLPFYARIQKMVGSQFAESLWMTLANKGEMKQCDFWKQDLVESSIQVLEDNANEWRPGQVCELSNIKEKFRFRLKWRDIS